MARAGLGLARGALRDDPTGPVADAVEALAELRGLATKAGQMAGVWSAALPEAERRRVEPLLARLRASTASSDPAAVRALVEAELGAPLGALFAEFDEAPFASASLGQVHRARLPAAEMKPLDLSELVTEVLALYAEKQEHGQLVARAAHPVPAILGDATQLRQVIHNLVQNSLDAVADREGGLVQVVTSAATSESGEPREVRLTIIDNGHGFAEKILKRAAEPYVTTKAKGTGLGLAVVKKIADEHGARFRVANLHARDDPDAPVIGARVSLSFPHLASAAAVQTVADATP
jgi:signal transduction histidine kinase